MCDEINEIEIANALKLAKRRMELKTLKRSNIGERKKRTTAIERLLREHIHFSSLWFCNVDYLTRYYAKSTIFKILKKIYSS